MGKGFTIRGSRVHLHLKPPTTDPEQCQLGRSLQVVVLVAGCWCFVLVLVLVLAVDVVAVLLLLLPLLLFVETMTIVQCRTWSGLE